MLELHTADLDLFSITSPILRDAHHSTCRDPLPWGFQCPFLWISLTQFFYKAFENPLGERLIPMRRPRLSPPNRSTDDLPFEDSIPFLLRNASRKFFRTLQLNLARYEITSSSWYFLRVLWTSEGMTQSELSQRVGLMTPTTTSTLNNMERSGLIERRPHPNDKRKYLIYLSKKGRELKPELLRAAREIHEGALEGLQDAQIRALKETIRIMESNLERMSSGQK